MGERQSTFLVFPVEALGVDPRRGSEGLRRSNATATDRGPTRARPSRRTMFRGTGSRWWRPTGVSGRTEGRHPVDEGPPHPRAVPESGQRGSGRFPDLHRQVGRVELRHQGVDPLHQFARGGLFDVLADRALFAPPISATPPGWRCGPRCFVPDGRSCAHHRPTSPWAARASIAFNIGRSADRADSPASTNSSATFQSRSRSAT